MGIISIKNLVHRFSKYGDNGEEIGEKTALEQVSLERKLCCNIGS